jgi:hypothetical protein
MRPILAICTAVLILSAIPSSASGLMATCAGGPEAGAPTAVSPAEPSLPDFMAKPVLKTTCTVTRTCDYPPPSSVSCTSASGNCSSGADGYAPYGYVQCDSIKTYCPPPPSCTVSCGSSVQCYSICQAGGQEPVTYQCLPSHHCCDCKY